METATLVCDMLAVANVEHGDKLQRYLQTGDARELGDFKIDSISNLKTTIEILQKLTGQDRQSTVKHQGEVMYSPGADKKMMPTPEEAKTVLKLLVGMKK